jgi:Ni/Co efflux regulator RcnB
MKKIIAIFMVVSFVMVNTTGAFAAQKINERGRVSGRVEHKQSDRRALTRRPDQPHRPSINRSDRLNRRPEFNRSAPLNRRSEISRPHHSSNSDFFRRNRPMASHNDSFFNRSRYYNRRPFPQYHPRPYYSGSHRHSNSMSPLEFLGIGAAIIAIAAAASHTCPDY